MSQGWFEVSKYKLVPGFYHPIIVVGVNLSKWNGLSSKARGVLTTAGLYLENELSADLGRKDREIGNQLVTKKGMTLLKLSDADSKKFLDLAYTAEAVKKKVGARGYPSRAYLQLMDHFNHAVMATMAKAS